MTNRPYNERDISSIFNYSKQLVNKCLRDFAPDAEEHNGKGSLGQLVEELFFKYDLNSRQEADFAFVNAELKCTPLKESAKKELLIKERLVCSMINYTADWNKTFEESHFYQKCLIMLIMFYLHNPKASKLDLQFLFAVLWKIPEKDLLIIRKDYDTIITKIRNGQAHTLSEGDTMYLGACRKGQKGESLMPQHNINAADYGMPQRRRRTYMVAYHQGTKLAGQFASKVNKFEWILENGIMPEAFCCTEKDGKTYSFEIGEDIADVSDNFNKGKKESPFKNSGVMANGKVYTLETLPKYEGQYITLGDILVDEAAVPNEFFISDEDFPKWEYQKGSKSLKRINKTTGFEYNYSEGAMAFPDYLDRASRTIITGEGGAGPSRFKHIIKTKSGRYRRLVPVELERLNMFPDNHTFGSSDLRRAFLMGNALVTGIVENIALVLKERM